MTPWWWFESSSGFAAHHAESLAANRWSLRHSNHEEVTNHSAHWTPLLRIHTMKVLNGIETFWNGYNSRKRRLLPVLLFRTWSTRWRQVTVQKACAYDVRKAPINDLLIFIHKTRGFEWQTTQTKGYQEKRCRLIASTDLWPEEMFTFLGNACAGPVWKLFRCLRLS